MDTQELSDHLSRIRTHWTLVFQAHQGQGEDANAASRQLLLRYYGAVYRYLLGTTRDAAAAEELTQEFAYRFLRGDFRRADPQRGRFRDFVKTAVRHLACDHWDRQKMERARGFKPLPDGPLDEAASPPAPDEADQEFVTSWREELLARAWEDLEAFQEKTGQPYHSALRCKTEHPQMRSAQLAEELGTRLRRTFTEEGVRQLVHRARQKFADLLVEEVAHSLQTADREALEQELIELDLLGYCQAALQRRQAIH
jgi:RNA polymerase sigma-70 factor (ECF subfamily)